MNLPLHNTQSTIHFLKQLKKDIWVLTAIHPKSSKITTASFRPKNEEAAFKWIEKRQGKFNLYFMVNEPLHELKTKAKKADVKEVSWLHVDVDPRPGEDFNDERVRGLKVLQEFDPPPTVIIDSGGGFQGFWKLVEPFVMNGDVAKAPEIEAYNKQIELMVQGDNCFNVDRIMRLPGTINLPNKQKMAKGRIAAPARIVETHWDRVYSLVEFTPAPKIRGSDGTGDGSGGDIPDNLPRLSSVEDLPEAVRPYTKLVIIQGGDPDDPNKYESRSEALFAVLCDLIRANVPIELIASVILDPAFGISASVLDKHNPKKYAERQILRAREYAIDPMLMELNDRHAVIDNIGGGKCRVMDEIINPILNRKIITFQSFPDFQNRYKNRKVVVGKDSKGNPIEKPAGTWWVEHPKRRQYKTIVYAPGQEFEGYLNLWKGFATTPKKGEWVRLKEHIYSVLAAGNEEAADYIIKWAAWAIQNPGKPAEAALVLIGGKGTGKGTFVRALCDIFGPHSLQISSPMHLAGRFNAHLRDVSLLFADEAYWPGDKAAEGTLKRLITEPTLAIEAKGVDLVETQNCLHVIMASNEDWVVPAGIDERRFAVFKVSDIKMQDEEWFKKIREELNKNGGLEAFHYDLQNMDLKGWHPRKIPTTAALSNQIERSLDPLSEWLNFLLEEAVLPEPQGGCENISLSKDLYKNLKETTPLAKNISMKRMGDFLRAQGCKPWSNGSNRGWEFLPLQTHRADWEKKIKNKKWRYPNIEWGREEIPF